MGAEVDHAHGVGLLSLHGFDDLEACPCNRVIEGEGARSGFCMPGTEQEVAVFTCKSTIPGAHKEFGRGRVASPMERATALFVGFCGTTRAHDFSLCRYSDLKRLYRNLSDLEASTAWWQPAFYSVEQYLPNGLSQRIDSDPKRLKQASKLAVSLTIVVGASDSRVIQTGTAKKSAETGAFPHGRGCEPCQDDKLRCLVSHGRFGLEAERSLRTPC